MSEGSTQPGSIVRPSSLNYKISLSEAVVAFIKKDMPVAETEYIDVQAEEPKTGSSANQNGKNNTPHVNPPGEAYDEFDDLMFDMTTPNTKASGNSKTSKNNPQTPMNAHNPTGAVYVSENGQTKDAWFREEELMRKKLEKGAIN